MSYIKYNPNPDGNYVGDCVIRAISKALDISWEEAYIELAMQGFMMKNMPSANNVWGSYLKMKGFKRYSISDECPDCYTIQDFCEEHSTGTYVLSTGEHAVAAIDGDYFDTFNSGDEIVGSYYVKEEGLHE